jgi:hypothetical protein
LMWYPVLASSGVVRDMSNGNRARSKLKTDADFTELRALAFLSFQPLT